MFAAWRTSCRVRLGVSLPMRVARLSAEGLLVAPVWFAGAFLYDDPSPEMRTRDEGGRSVRSGKFRLSSGRERISRSIAGLHMRRVYFDAFNDVISAGVSRKVVLSGQERILSGMDQAVCRERDAHGATLGEDVRALFPSDGQKAVDCDLRDATHVASSACAEDASRVAAAVESAASFSAEEGRSRRVAVGMSGGVDSAAAALVLARAGYDVVGVTCGFLGNESDRRAASDARAVCDALGVPHSAFDCSSWFADAVVRPFIAAYEAGLTPSPCPGCNAHIKIPALLTVADREDCSYVATGHYARIARLTANGRYAVLRALDAAKDQSYMLALLDQDELSRLVLPLGGLTKAEVRIMAEDAGLPVANKPDSQDICFAPHGYRDLLASDAPACIPGPIVDVHGCVVGRHEGLAQYTVGQRKGIGVAGPRPYYVVEKRLCENELVVGFAEDAACVSVVVGDMVWQATEPPLKEMPAMVKLRYRSGAVACIIEPRTDDRVLVRLASPQPLTAPGQVAVFSMGDTVLGGGTIEEVRRA